MFPWACSLPNALLCSCRHSSFFLFASQPHTLIVTRTHRHTQSSAIKTNKYKAIAALGEFVSSYECVCKEEAHTHTQTLTYTLAYMRTDRPSQ